MDERHASERDADLRPDEELVARAASALQRRCR